MDGGNVDREQDVDQEQAAGWNRPAPGVRADGFFGQLLRGLERITTARIDPVSGWAQADLGRRLFAVALLPSLFAWLMVAIVTPVEHSAGVLAGLLLPVAIPPMMYSAARVVRPYRAAGRPGLETAARHWCAAVAMGLGTPTALALWVLGSGVELGPASSESAASAGTALLVIPLGGTLAALLGVVTLVWGVVAAAARGAAAVTTTDPLPARPTWVPAQR